MGEILEKSLVIVIGLLMIFTIMGSYSFSQVYDDLISENITKQSELSFIIESDIQSFNNSLKAIKEYNYNENITGCFHFNGVISVYSGKLKNNYTQLIIRFYSSPTRIYYVKYLLWNVQIFIQNYNTHNYLLSKREFSLFIYFY